MGYRLLAVALLASACRVEVDFDGTRYRCEASGAPCPAPLECLAGYCQAGDAPDGGSPSLACLDGETAGPYGSDFEAGAPSWASVDENPLSPVRFEAGLLEIAPDYDPLAGMARSAVSSPASDLHGTRVAVEVPQMVDASTGSGAEAALTLQGASSWATLVQRKGALHLIVHYQSGTEDIQSLLYEPGPHRYWQLRDRLGFVLFELSPDGGSWTEHSRAPEPEDLSASTIELSAGTTQATGAPPGEVHFDDLVHCRLP